MNIVENVLAKCDHLVATGLWPREQQLPYRSWLNNFDEDQKVPAAKILNHLIFINEDMAHSALAAAYQRLLRSRLPNVGSTMFAPPGAITACHDSIVVTPARGEEPNAADSAYAYVRAARDVLGLGEHQIAEDVASAIELARELNGLVVLVDDIVGSGEQILANMNTQPSSSSPSLATIAEKEQAVACLTTIMTSRAYDRLKAAFPNLLLLAGHILDVEVYNVQAILPSKEHQDVHDLLNEFAPCLSVPQGVHPIYGYNKLGLILAFHNSIPDFSLPILWAQDGPSWIPLKGRPDA